MNIVNTRMVDHFLQKLVFYACSHDTKFFCECELYVKLVLLFFRNSGSYLQFYVLKGLHALQYLLCIPACCSLIIL